MDSPTTVAEALRDGLRRLAKAVVVITCRHEGQRYAMAATAVSELSMDPPSLLICVNRSASLYAPLSEGADFCVNILHSDHSEISTACSGKEKGEARFAFGNWGGAPDGCPVLADAQASFLCRNDKAFDYGTHHIVIGQVEEVAVNGSVSPLIYVDGRYARIGNPLDLV
ncbi:flavin reductase family protein [Parasphingopyxis marina]|uniref:Flavin reductase family protein n=1 Tax=Parasphingopyxis marina TaxID=2761622 RepID=A0A842HUP5_9SPHN|nr:flavin reductase family protein [Parasphingopyxis marina]MBC2776655.1 flavin reductase family protein [Parasphingopyxis marina]